MVSDRQVVPIGQVWLQSGRQNGVGTPLPPAESGRQMCSGRGQAVLGEPTHGCTHAEPAQQNEPAGQTVGLPTQER
jgi:hypothetical protein